MFARIIVMLATSLALTIAASAAPRLLKVPETCPATGEYAACVDGWIREFDDKSLRVEGEFPRAPRLAVQGRLNGGPVESFTVEINQWRGEIEIGGGVAYLGRSAGNHPVFLTDAGALEVITRKADVWMRSEHLVEAKTWRRLADFVSTSLPLVISSAADIDVWDRKRKLCISAPLNRPGRLKLRPQGCAAHHEMAARVAPRQSPAYTPSRMLSGIVVLATTGRGFHDSLESHEEQATIENGGPVLNAEPFKVKLSTLKRYFPKYVDIGMDANGTFASVFRTEVTHLDVKRINGSVILLVTYHDHSE
jgi:hypothetical protein